MVKSNKNYIKYMTITINRKRVNSIYLFPTIEDFIILLKSEYNSINFDNENIKSLISSIYKQCCN